MLTTEDQKKIAEEATHYVKTNKSALCDRFASLYKYPSNANPVSVFMAGSPGAGKTEFSKSLINQLGKDTVRIDADEIRVFLRHYFGHDSETFQRASALGVEKLYDRVLKNKQNVILDGTFADYDKSLNNIQRSLDRDRPAKIFYLFQDPTIAWEFTKAREAIEHRNVPKEVFIESFLLAKDNVNKAKAYYGKNVELNLVIKNFENRLEKLHLNILNVDNYLKVWYDRNNLEETLL